MQKPIPYHVGDRLWKRAWNQVFPNGKAVFTFVEYQVTSIRETKMVCTLIPIKQVLVYEDTGTLYKILPVIHPQELELRRSRLAPYHPTLRGAYEWNNYWVENPQFPESLTQIAINHLPI